MGESIKGGVKKQLTSLMGAFFMPKVARKMKDKHGIVEPEAEFKQELDHWVTSGLAGKDFFGDDKPDFIDCSVFGVLHSSHRLGVIELASQNNADFEAWYERCMPLMSTMNKN